MKQTPSIRSANWLYLISILLILTIGSSVQKLSFGWGLLATEFLLILLPTILLMRYQRLPVAETVCLRWPGWALVVLGLGVGVGLWLVDVMINGIVVEVSGYMPVTPPNTYPTTPFQAALAFTALALAPPLCEEILFRGYVQRAYEARSRKMGFVITALLFAFYHFRLQGLLALLPIAFVLGFMRMRSGSIWPGMMAHFANNALAAGLIIVAGLSPDWLAKLPLNSFLLPAIVLGLASLVVFARLTRTRKPATTPIVAAPEAPTHFLTGAALPLVLTGLLYVGMAGLEVAYGRFSDSFAKEPLTLSQPPWTQATTWRYEVRNAADELVGDASCAVTPINANYALDCQSNIKAFQVETPGSFYQSGDYQSHLVFEWAGDDLSLVGGETSAVNDGRLQETTLTASTGTMQLAVHEDGRMQSMTLPESALMPDEWAWRLMALPFDLELNQKATYVYPSFWDAEMQANRPTSEAITIVVTRSEPLALPAGNFIAWRVKVGKYWTAWYDVNAPHTLLKYDAGFATYLLTDIDP